MGVFSGIHQKMIIDLQKIAQRLKFIPVFGVLHSLAKKSRFLRYVYFLFVYFTRPKPANNIARNLFSWKNACIKNSELKNFFSWGGGDENKEKLYHQLRDMIKSASQGKTVLEIGSFDGNWTKEILNAKSIICVDLFEEGFPKIKQRLQGDNLAEVSFYKTKGDELNGITNETVDFVFSIDSLVRAPRKAMYKYFYEIFRVLKKDGMAILHLAIMTDTNSLISNFTCFFKWELHFLLRKFSSITFKKIIPHGIILILTK